MTFRVLLWRESAVATLTCRTRIRAMHQHKTTDANEKKRILIDTYQQNMGIYNKIVILFAQTTNYSYALQRQKINRLFRLVVIDLGF